MPSGHLNPLLSLLFAANDTPLDPRRKFLLDRGWVTLGAEAFTGIEGWGKVIEARAVTVPIDEALKIEGWE